MGVNAGVDVIDGIEMLPAVAVVVVAVVVVAVVGVNLAVLVDDTTELDLLLIFVLTPDGCERPVVVVLLQRLADRADLAILAVLAVLTTFLEVMAPVLEPLLELLAVLILALTELLLVVLRAVLLTLA